MREPEKKEPFSITRRNNIIHVCFSPGCILEPELVAEVLKREVEFDGGARSNDLWDFRGCEMGENLVYQAVVNLVSYIRTLRKDRWHRKSALIVGKDFQFGMARMYESLTEGMPHESRVFRDEQKAMAWLEEE